MDVQLTKDKQLVALWGSCRDHSGKPKCSFELTYEQLCKTVGRKLLNISNLCSSLNGQASFNLDVKDWSDSRPGYKHNLVTALVELVVQNNLQSNVLFESFNLEYVKAIKAVFKRRGIDVLVGLAVHRQSSERTILTALASATEASLYSVFLYPEQLTVAVVDALNSSPVTLITNDQLNSKLRQALTAPIITVSTSD